MRKKKKLTGTIDDYKMVHVITHDWVSNSEWMSISKAKKLEPAKCHSIGRLFNKTKTKIQLFGSWSIDEDGSIVQLQVAPKAGTLIEIIQPTN